MATPTRSAPRPSAIEPSGVIPTVLAARGIKKTFVMGERKLEILHGIELDLAQGELVALVGASGAGKSTLLHCLGVLDKPTEGTVWIDGIDTWRLPITARAELRNDKVGFVFQFYHLLPELDALENVLLPAMIAHSTLAFRARRGELRDRAEAMLERSPKWQTANSLITD